MSRRSYIFRLYVAPLVEVGEYQGTGANALEAFEDLAETGRLSNLSGVFKVQVTCLNSQIKMAFDVEL